MFNAPKQVAVWYRESNFAERQAAYGRYANWKRQDKRKGKVSTLEKDKIKRLQRY